MKVQIEAVNKVYKGGTRALQDITLEIGIGMFGLLGPNGAGKTTLMRIIATLLRPTEGSVCVDGLDVTKGKDAHEIKQKLGYLPQELGLYPELSAYEFLDYMALLKQIYDAKKRRQEVERLLELVGLVEAKNKKVRTFSGGMKRRLGVAQALIGEPELLIVDEPTAGLDPEERVRFRILFAQLSQARTVILATHLVEDVAQICPDMGVLNQGKLLFHGEPQELINQVQGKVWLVEDPKEDLLAKVEVVSMIGTKEGERRYRIVAERSVVEGAGVTPQEPTLEDGYIYLMKGANKEDLKP
jgi:ABC-type multidrug transport system ATPase subunit